MISPYLELSSLYKQNEPLVIFDIGACDGMDSIKYSKYFPNSRIFLFEPLPTNIELIKQNIELHEKQNIVFFELALSNTSGSSIFFKSAGHPDKNSSVEWNMSNSLLEPNLEVLNKLHPWLKFNETINVKTERLDTFCISHDIDKIDFIHMDVQGAEMMVLEGAGEFLHKIKAIWLEVSTVELYMNQAIKKEIVKFLSQYNFKLVADTSKKSAEGDCFFINCNQTNLLQFNLSRFSKKLLKFFSHENF